MTHPLFNQHQAKLQDALEAISSRGYWSAYAEIPSPKVYGEGAAEAGKAAFAAHLGQRFALQQPGLQTWLGGEQSPYGKALNVEYPVCAVQALIDAGQAAIPAWQALGVAGRAGLCIEMLDRLNQASFEIAHAVMMTTGQGWMMAFQAGAAHAQDRGLEAVAYAYREQNFVPADVIWEKPQGKNPPLRMQKHFEIVGCGVAVVVACSTFPTWNTYPGLFAALATGNAVIIKPHEQAILPVAITVRILRTTLSDAGLNPDLVSLCVVPNQQATQALVTHAAVKSVDFTGSTSFGNWLIDHCRQAQVYAELAGVNTIVIDSTDAYQAMLRNLAFSLCLYSGQMCTTSQVLLVPADGIVTDEGCKSYAQLCTDLTAAIDATLAKPEIAYAVLGAIQSPLTVARIDEANSGKYGTVLRAAQTLPHPEFPAAIVRSPVLLAVEASAEAAYMEERFGPISFVVKTADITAAITLAHRIVSTHGALTLAVYSTNNAVIDAITQASCNAKVALSINLTSGVFVNQSAAFSDYHGSGGNPAANASYCNSAFVANRFRVIQRRYHV